MLVLCVMPTAMMQLSVRIQNVLLRRSTSFLIFSFSIFMLIGRLFSGVHWLSDIIGGILLSTGLVSMYDFVRHLKPPFQKDPSSL